MAPPAKAVPRNAYSSTKSQPPGRKFAQYIKPMLAKPHEAPFDDDDWVYEIKWDGYRAVAEIDDGVVRLYSRNGLSFEDKYPVIYTALQAIKKKGLVLDGEIVALDKDGIPRFGLLQQYSQVQAATLCYYVFDCLKIRGTIVEDMPLLKRKEILRELLPESNVIRYCDHVAGRGKEFFRLVQKMGLEGMMAKKADSTYDEGVRSASWLKIKHIQTEEAVIAGYTQPGGSRQYFGALVLGIYRGDRLTYIGHTGTGFNDKDLKEVYAQMQDFITTDSSFDEDISVNAPVTWLLPRLVCNIKYSEITDAGLRRHPVFMGLRIDKPAEEVQEEVNNNKLPIETTKRNDMKSTGAEKTAKKTKSILVDDTEQVIDGKPLTFTNTDKVFWPAEHYTKGDVINYYNTIYPYIINYLKGRPESLLRMPNGILSPGFFHKDAGGKAPEWVDTCKIFSESADKEVDYIICNNKPTLLYLANLGCIEINPWCSRLKTIDNPDYLVIDIDPSEENTFEQVIEVANVVKDVLDRAKANSYPKTSGATGLHIYVPLGAKYDYGQAKDFAHLIAQMVHEQLPQFTSLERSLSKRGKRMIYIDYLQNRKGQTLAAPYSLRPKPGAPVSAPLQWKEVKTGLSPSDFTIDNIISRVRQKGDLFAGVLKRGINMNTCLRNLEK